MNRSSRIVIIIVCIQFLFSGCQDHDSRVIPKQAEKIAQQSVWQALQYKGITLRLNQVVNCRYPVHDPVYFNRKYMKLILIDLSVTYENHAVTDKNLVIPAGATLWDSRGNAYESTPGVIAMAQNSHCIKGDDLDSYNAVWNATIQPGETKRAFLLGFELPSDAIPAKLCWNRQWERQNLCIILNDTTVVNN